MRATARVVGCSVRAKASGIVRGSSMAFALPMGIRATASATDMTGISKYLRVTPETPQQLIWLVPQYGIDYYVESNTDWNIK
jgi:hypothetical protein